MSAYITLNVVTVSQDIASNTSQVDITFSVTSSGATYNEMGDTSGYIELDGKRIADLAGKRFSRNTTTTLYRERHTVAHNSDGTKSILVKAGFDLNTSSYGWMYADKKLTLSTIPRASSVAAANFTIGIAGTIRINRASSDFTHALRYSIGSASGSITDGRVSGDTVTWTPHAFLAAQLPDTVSREVDVICETYPRGSLVGTTHNKVMLIVPENYRPAIQSVTLTPVNSNSWLSRQGIYVERYTKCRVQTSATAGQGSSISRIAIAGIGTGSGADWTSDYLSGGSKTVTVTAYDRRPGRQETASRTISVYSYAMPAISAAEVFRCDAKGKVQEDGTYLRVYCRGEVTSLDGRNTLILQMRVRPSGGGWGGYTALTNGAVKVIPGFSAQKSFEVELTVKDNLGEAKTIVYTVPTAEVALHLRPGGKGMAVGKYSEKEAFECAMNAEFSGTVTAPRVQCNSLMCQGNTVADFVVDQGVSGIWRYRKWASGLAECWGNKFFPTVNVAERWGNLFTSADIGRLPFPTGLFVEAPRGYDNVYNGVGDGMFIGQGKPPTATVSASVLLLRPSDNLMREVTLVSYAEGRWKR